MNFFEMEGHAEVASIFEKESGIKRTIHMRMQKSCYKPIVSLECVFIVFRVLSMSL